MMKRWIIVFSLFVMIAVSCEQSPHTDPVVGSFWIGDTEYSVTGAYYTHQNINDTVPIITLALYSGFEYHPASSTIGQLTGYGNLLEINYRAEASQSLNPATCSFTDSLLDNSILSSQLMLGYTISTNRGDSVVFNQGNVVISDIPEGKHLTFQFSSLGTATLTGHYSGPVRFYKLRSDQN